MKKYFLVSILLGALPLSMFAQDDLYFVPKKKSTTQATDSRGMPKNTYYSGSNRSVDEYNRRGSSYEVISNDSVNDIIDFSAVQGVYPDSIGNNDFELTKKMQRFEDYNVSDNEAFWVGYQAGRYNSSWYWHSPWYYRSYAWYGGWYDPWYYGSWSWYDPWYWDYAYWYSPYYGIGYGYPYFGWRSYYGWNHPHYYYGGGSVGRHVAHHGNTGSIDLNRGRMNGRVYNSSGGYSGSTRLGASRTSSLRSQTVSGHRAYNRGSYSGSNNAGSSRSSYGTSRGSTFSGGSYGGGGGSFSGGSSGGSRGGSFSGGSSGGGGSRAGGGGGGHVGGRR